MSKPFFSLIVPTLNEARYLPKLLSDLASQTYQDFEVVVVDGGSTDKTLALAQAYSSKLNLSILSSPRPHVCTQRNLGAKRAKSDTLIFSDADNRLPPYFLQGVKYRLESTDVDLLSFWLKPDILTRQNELIAQALNAFLELQNNLKPAYLLESMFVISKSCFKAIKGFDESLNYAEGKSLIHNLAKLGYRSKIFRDPTFTFSFRRFRKYGVLGIAGRVAKMELSELLGPEFHAIQAQKLYPMTGGTLFSKPKRVQNKFLKNIAKLLKDF